MGGNAIKQWNQQGTAAEQYENVKTSCAHIVKIIQRGYRVVITHGNGPQVGNLLIQQALLNELKDARLTRNVVTLVTQVMVDREDPGFRNPTKPVGPFYTKAQMEKYEKNGGMVFKRIQNQEGEHYRRVVASPDPLRILEGRMVKDLFERGAIVIASGGGGIPVIMDENGHVSGVEAVIDKDLAGEKLAEAVGADLFMVLTDVEKVFLHYGTKRQTGLGKISLDKAQQYVKSNQFPAGSMGPKVEACIRFIKYGGERSIITSLDRAVNALDGKTGTHILPDKRG